MTFVSAAWMSRQPLADRIAAWALAGAPRASSSVLEPSAGEGAIALGLLRAGVEPGDLTLVELDGGRYRLLREAFAMSTVLRRDFLLYESEQWEDGGHGLPPFGLTVANPPFDDGADTDHVEAMSLLSERVTCLVRLAFLTGSDRQSKLWDHCRLRRVAYLTNRPTFVDRRSPEERLLKSKSGKEAEGGPKHDFAVIDLERMTGRHEGWSRELYPRDQVETEWWTI